MKGFISANARPLFYILWFVLGLIQALFTELQDDEAYYWVYAHYLDWGYFDHPPMIAVLIKWGSSIFGGELGVRFFPLLLGTLTLYITEKLVAPKNLLLFYAVVLSAAVLQIIGYWAVPDIPLLFFTALFFWCYKRWIQNFSLPNTLLFALACALLMYTKYHGALIIIFTILSNIKLLARWQLWVAGVVALVLFAPHLYWQYQHNWMSFRYHLFESNVNPYKFSYTTEYLAGQLLIAGPLAGIIFWAAAFTYKPKDLFQKALKFTAIGFAIFFFLSSFKGRVEANWTAPAIVPLLLLTYYFVEQKEGWRKWLYRLLAPALVLVFIFRIVMMVDVVPARPVVKMFHSWKGWPQQLKAAVGETPIVFSNSYQRASKAWFYTGNVAYSQSSYKERRSNYNFWPVEDSLLGKGVYFMDIYDIER
ncbi:MAG: ArnT family glycosyltransferase, partial [Chitinophagaceae bacterium]